MIILWTSKNVLMDLRWVWSSFHLIEPFLFLLLSLHHTWERVGVSLWCFLHIFFFTPWAEKLLMRHLKCRKRPWWALALIELLVFLKLQMLAVVGLNRDIECRDFTIAALVCICLVLGLVFAHICPFVLGFETIDILRIIVASSLFSRLWIEVSLLICNLPGAALTQVSAIDRFGIVVRNIRLLTSLRDSVILLVDEAYKLSALLIGNMNVLSDHCVNVIASFYLM